MLDPGSTVLMSFYAYDPADQVRSALYLASRTQDLVKPTRVLIVDRDAAVRDALSLTLEANGFRVEPYGSAGEFLNKASVKGDSCLLIEYDLSDMTGIDLLARLSMRRIDLPAVIMSARLRPLVFESPKPAGIIAVLQKPFGQDALLQCLRHVLAHPRVG